MFVQFQAHIIRMIRQNRKFILEEMSKNRRECEVTVKNVAGNDASGLLPNHFTCR